MTICRPFVASVSSSDDGEAVVVSVGDDVRSIVPEFESWNARRPASPELLDPEVQWDMRNHPVPEIRGVYNGRDEVRQFWMEWLPAWASITADGHWVRGQGDRVVAWITQRMVGNESGVALDFTYGWDVIIRDGMYARVAFFTDERDALAAVGR